jgi:hypothetical protein
MSTPEALRAPLSELARRVQAKREAAIDPARALAERLTRHLLRDLAQASGPRLTPRVRERVLQFVVCELQKHKDAKNDSLADFASPEIPRG